MSLPRQAAPLAEAPLARLADAAKRAARPAGRRATLIEFVPLTEIDGAIDSLLDEAFGRDRHRRTAYRIRGDAAPIAQLSFAAMEHGAPIGSIQCWPVTLHGDDAHDHALTMIGPVAVAPDRQRDGIGRLLMTHALRAAHDLGLDDALMLIGDPEYYGRFFGFDAAATGAWRLPGPVERRRLLARGDAVPAIAGALGPAR